MTCRSSTPLLSLASALLLTLAERFGEEPAGGGAEVPVALSRGELARFVHATLETVSRTMSAWGKEGLVETREDGFRIPDPARLRRVLDPEGEATGRAPRG